ncbi:MAG: N-6 DNA methylase [Flavobacteriales bacterium]|nr:N-6 DNA methylase [Flavobacteriales bacterium]
MEHRKFFQALGFIPKENTAEIYTKRYAGDYTIDIDFAKEQILYGDKIVCESKTTQNFSQPENFVVLECVNRLLEKGYRPENIILEKTWGAGHGTSGRLDICVTRDDGSEYLLIECKTRGKEFEKELKRMAKDGGQLFTYFKFSNKADLLMLYASEVKSKEVTYQNEIVKVEDDYRVGDVKDFYDKWNKLTKDNGVFDLWVNPYQFVSKALTPKQLKPIQQEDSGFIFNRFLEILRHNVVSDKPNAFNKIFTLFLCKVYDEKSTKPNEELKFQWLEGVDDDVSFQIRLTDLYKNGMMEFLEKEVTDFSVEEFEREYVDLDEVLKKRLLTKINKLRLEKNNEFAIKEVFDEKSFNENAKVVKEIVELLQGYRLRYNKRQQYLSDFFELLLTTGLKQESGQFFTPVPIAQFIIKSLPIDTMVDEKLEKGERNNLLPYIIDYAAGSGHFLTESMHEVQRLVDAKNPSDYIEDTRKKVDNWHGNHFDWATQYVYGIEKDYRLVKVGKVGCYLHGDGLANVILSDGLGSFRNNTEYKELLRKTDPDFPQDNRQFDMLVSNPPYSVAAFKNAARQYYRDEDFALYDRLTDNSSEIECLFVERTKQLLRDGGVAGVILPSSILSNSGIYTRAREVILNYFDIIAIAELGSNTFMATGTNTVTLFLRRRNNYIHINLRKAVERFFGNGQEVTMNGVEHPVQKYVTHVWEGLSVSDYLTLLQQKPNGQAAVHELYKDYCRKIKAKTDKEFWEKLLRTEQEKLCTFLLVWAQHTVVIKSGEKAAEKRFLGYEFSFRRGSEGIHPIQRGKSISECTQLFDEDSFDNPEKAATYIHRAYKGDYTSEVHDSLKANITRHRLVDMITFDRADFEKSISLAVKKKVTIESRWTLVRIGDVCETGSGGTPLSGTTEYYLNGSILWINSSEVRQGVILDSENKITEAGLINSSAKIFPKNTVLLAMYGATAGQVGILGVEASTNQAVCGIMPSERILPYYLYYVLREQYENILSLRSGVARLNISQEIVKDMRVPLPPLSVQQQVVGEVEKIEKREEELREEVGKLQVKIDTIVTAMDHPTSTLGQIASFKNGLNYSRNSSGELVSIVGVGEFQENFSPDMGKLEKVQVEGKLSEEYELRAGDILVVRSNGSANLVGRFLFISKVLEKTSYSGFTIRIRTNPEEVNSKFLCHCLRTSAVREKMTTDSKGSNIKSLNQTLLASIQVPLPPLSEQQRILSEIEAIETRIQNLEEELAALPPQKQAVLKKYL